MNIVDLEGSRLALAVLAGAFNAALGVVLCGLAPDRQPVLAEGRRREVPRELMTAFKFGPAVFGAQRGGAGGTLGEPMKLLRHSGGALFVEHRIVASRSGSRRRRLPARAIPPRPRRAT